MKCSSWADFYSISYVFVFLFVCLVSETNACDVMGSRACGQRPDKDVRESDPVKYCIASRVYFECVHKKYRGCENKEKYEAAMESMMKGRRCEIHQERFPRVDFRSA